MDKKFCDDCKQEIPRDVDYVTVRMDVMNAKKSTGKFSYREYCTSCAKLHVPDPSR